MNNWYINFIDGLNIINTNYAHARAVKRSKKLSPVQFEIKHVDNITKISLKYLFILQLGSHSRQAIQVSTALHRCYYYNRIYYQ